ncbi:acetyltransferase [Colletotrichum tabaci]|uniref:Acetyltransferase n=1 Tax=Colletotrichum tabaci TaxID=1209068 RepID=A0AAV9TRD0_9PEZI
MAPTKQASHLPTLLRSPTHPILLRTMEPRDAAALSAVLSDPENTKYDPHASAISPEVARVVIDRMRESAAVPTVLDDATGRVASGPGRVNLVIVYVDGVENTVGVEGGEGVVVGLGGFGGIDEHEEEVDEKDGEGKAKRVKVRVGDVGAMVNPGFRGRGFATEAIRLAVEWAFTRVEDGGPQFDRVTATMGEANKAMVGLVERKFGWKGVAKPGEEEGGGEIFFEVGPRDWKK